MRCRVFIFFLFIALIGSAQYSVIPTGTSTKIRLIRKFGNVVVINGNENYLSKCYGDCDSLINLTAPGPYNYFNNNLVVLDTDRFYVSSFNWQLPYHGVISETSDGGNTWNTLYDSTSSDVNIVGFTMFDTTHGAFTCLLDRTFVTHNGGAGWGLGTSHAMGAASSLHRMNDSTAVMGGEGKLRYTTDRCNSWNNAFFGAGENITPMNFCTPSADSLYVVGISPVDVTLSYSFATITNSNASSNWTRVSIPDLEVFGIAVLSRNEIYLTGKSYSLEKGRILKTTDLGLNWTFMDIPITEKLLDIAFINDSVALIGGYDGTLIKWNKNSTMSPLNLSVQQNAGTECLIYPNPGKESLTAKVGGMTGNSWKVEIFDAQGKLVLSNTFQTNDSGLMELNTSKLERGVYQVIIGNGREVIRKPWGKM